MRVFTILKTADVVFAKDTRMTSKLLAIQRFNRPLHSAAMVAAARGRPHREVRPHAQRQKQSDDGK